MNLRIEIEDAASNSLRELMTATLPAARRQMITKAGTQVLEGIVEDHPVRSGRARAAWSNALAQLGGRPTFPGTDAGAIADGRSRGTVSASDEVDRTLASATNAVDYIPFLEYGTRRMAPFAMVRRALAATISRMSTLFSLTQDGPRQQR